MIARAHLAAHPRHLGWTSRAVVSGFLASIAALLVLVAAYGFASAVGTTSSRAGVFAAWAYHLANNKVTSLVSVNVHVVQATGLHLIAGIVWATIYAAFFEPNFGGKGWRKGLIFSALPCLVSLFAFLPLVGAGVFGMSLGAGPLAGLGAIVLHAVYGVVLGETYALADGEGVLGGVNSPQSRVFTSVERDMAAGIVAGALLGLVIGLIISAVGVGSAGSNGMLLTATGAATEGAFIGIVVGIFVGLITSE
jgi:hypothetical protein